MTCAIARSKYVGGIERERERERERTFSSHKMDSRNQLRASDRIAVSIS